MHLPYMWLTSQLAFSIYLQFSVTVILSDIGLSQLCCRIPDMASNAQLNYAFRKLHDQIINTVNPDQLIDCLYSNEILSAGENATLLEIPHKMPKTRSMLSILHKGGHPQAFVVLRQAIVECRVYQHLVKEIDAYALDVRQDTPNNAITVGNESKFCLLFTL